MEYDNDTLSRYPFLPDAVSTLRKLPVSALVGDDEYSRIMEYAVGRIRSAGIGRMPTTGIAEMCSIGEKTFLTEVVAFAACLFILATPKLRKLSRRWALAEAELARSRISQDIMKGKTDTMAAIASDILGITVRISDRHVYEIDIMDYIRMSVGISGVTWKLVNQRVDGGAVFLTQHSLVRLIQEGVRLYIIGLFKTVTAVPQSRFIEDTVERLSREYPPDPTPERPTANPPCVTHAIEALEKNENLSHMGRFLLGTFLIKAGRTVDEIVPYFVGAPDYSEKITRYQLNQIANGGDGMSGYACPSCSKIKSNNLCFETEECAGIINPAQFRRRG